MDPLYGHNSSIASDKIACYAPTMNSDIKLKSGYLHCDSHFLDGYHLKDKLGKGHTGRTWGKEYLQKETNTTGSDQ